VQSDGTLLGWASAGRLTPTVNTDVTGVTSLALGNEPNLVIGHSAFVPVPDLTGDGRAQAATALQNAGFVLGSVGSVVDNSCNNIGVVFSQSPDAGTSLHIGSAVSITLGVRPKHGCP
jgi:beta-lactam-binding protein with PASTA domain